jgi:hypothetical protein
MTNLRRLAIVVFVAGATVFTARRVIGHRDAPGQPPGFMAEERRVMEHRADSILGLDGRTGQPVRLGFPTTRPVIAFLYQSTCGACQLARPGWEQLVAAVGHRAQVMMATLDPPDTGTPFLNAGTVLDLHLDLAGFRRAFAVWEVVPITLLIEPAGHISWVRFGPLDQGSINSLVAALDR